ncbi:MAG TPA: flagellar protein FlgN [Cellvibrionaceae bacterium]|nr:flagellar protein FlgN [Cellvibrionaceae bacterium]
MQPEPLKQIADSIESDITACEQLIRLLHHERDLLAERAFEPLDLIIQEKAAWLKKLEHSARLRQSCLETSGLTQTADPSAAFLQWLTEHNHEHLSERWALLKHLLNECQEANDVNGKLIHRGQATHQTLVGILRGQDHQTMLYTGKGVKKATGLAAPIGKA